MWQFIKDNIIYLLQKTICRITVFRPKFDGNYSEILDLFIGNNYLLMVLVLDHVLHIHCNSNSHLIF